MYVVLRFWPYRLVVRTPAFQADNRGSIPRRATMLILSIETSCDDTACAVLKITAGKKPKFEILSNVVSSQIKIHTPFGGVVPTRAAREHTKNLPVVFRRALREAKTTIEKIDYIAVTQGPGLIIALWTGVNFARELAQRYGKKIILANHIAGHIFSNFIENPVGMKFPLLNIVVSGGHTELILMKKMGNYEILGSTRDDAAGEAFDKFAKMLGLGYLGWPIVSKLAQKGDPTLYPLPRPMIASKDYDLYFSGIKTAALYFFKKHPWVAEKKFLLHFCASFEQAIVDVIVSKTIRAAKEYKVKTVALSGGVSANQKLRDVLGTAVKKELPKTRFLAPNRKFTTDNAVMIAVAAYFNRKKATSWENLDADANLELI